MAGEKRIIEVTVVSANNLKKVTNFGLEQKCYAEVYIYPSQKHYTKEDNYGGVNPTWDEKITLTCFGSHTHPPSSQSVPFTSEVITVNIFCKSSGSFHHEPHFVGTVTIPLLDADAKAAPNGIMKVYDVHREGGEIQGILFLSVKLGPFQELGQCDDPYVAGVQMDNETVMAYPIYAFDPLSQMAAPGQHHEAKPFDPLGQYRGQNYQQAYTVPGERPMYLEKCDGNCQMYPQH